MEIRKRNVDFLEGRLVCVQFIEGRIAIGVCGGWEHDGEITILEPAINPEKAPSLSPCNYSQDKIKKITLLGDDDVVSVLSLAIKRSKRARELLVSRIRK